MDNKAMDTGGGNPYKGLFSYEEKDKDLFYGRRTEQRDLFRLVTHNFLTVVFGKSGIGKTSLLQAGLFPIIRENGFLPVKLRLDYSPGAAGLTQQVREEIKKELNTQGITLRQKMAGEKGAEPIGSGETLWEYFHRVRHVDGSGQKEITPVLVFDQFEEIFTLGKNHRGVDEFLDELYYLIENQFPESVKERLLKEEDVLLYDAGHGSPDVRVLISLREDYLPHLNSLKSRVPSINRVTFRVLHLNGRQGREIIRMPGGIRDDQIEDDILGMFSPEDAKESIADEKLEIEPSILSLLCFQLWEKEKEGAAFMTNTDKNRILQDFYDSVMSELPEEVETFIESKLLTEEGFRTPYYLERNHPRRESLDRLVNRRILRKAPYGEKEHIEIIHDVLAPVIKEKRNKRQEEKKSRELQEKLRAKRRVIWIITAAAIVSIIFALFAVERWIAADKQIKKYRKTQISRLTSDAELILPEDNVKAIRIAEAAYKMAFPHPPLRLLQALSDIQASTFERPFYNINMQHSAKVHSAIFSPDGSRILTASGFSAQLWDLQGNSLVEFMHEGFVNSAVFSPNGSRILTTSGKTARFWDLQGKQLAQFRHTGSVYSAVFSPNGSRVLTASSDKTARFWDLQGKQLAQFRHGSSVISAIFSPDGSRILTTASWDKTARLWDLQGKCLAQFKHKKVVSSAVFSPDGSRILTASHDKTAKIWDLQGKSLAQFKLGNVVRSAVFSPDGSRILTASGDNTARLWDLQGEPIAQFKHNDEVWSAVFSSDCKLILTASGDKTARLWDLQRSPLVQFKHTGSVNSAVFSPNGRRILTASWDNTARLWDLQGEPIAQFKHNDEVWNAVFSPDCKLILTASGDKTARLWDLQGKDKPLAEFKHDFWVCSAVFSPNGRRILTASGDKTARLWDLQGHLLAQFNHNGPIFFAVFSPDGSRILTASGDNTAGLCDLQGNLLAQFEHKGSVHSAVFSPDGSRILTASFDNTAGLWDLQGKDKPLAQFTHNGPVYSAEFSSDGSRILTASDDTARLWYTPEALIQWLKTADIPQLTKKDKERLGID